MHGLAARCGFGGHAVMSPAKAPVPFVVLFKAAVGFGLGALVVFGAAAPYLGIEAGPVSSGIIAGIGTVVGTILARRG